MIWPFPPLTPMLEGLLFRTDSIRTFSSAQRVRLLDIPRRTFNHKYRWTQGQSERARNILRAQLPGPLEVPDWSDIRRATALSGATSVDFDNTAPELTAADSVVILQNWKQFELLDIDSATATGVTLSTPLSGSYSDAVVLPLIECDAMDGLDATRSVLPTREAQIEWVSYSGRDVADDNGAPTYRGNPVLIHCSRLGDGTMPFGMTHPFEAVDNGLARPFLDTTQEQAVQRFGAAWQPTSRAESFALRQWFHYLKGRQRAFWIPDMNQALGLASSMVAGAGSISIRNVGFSDAYGSGDLFLRTVAGAVYTLQVASSSPSGTSETLVLSSPAPANVSVSQVEQLCMLFCVTLASDRIEWAHRAKPGPRVVVDVEQVPVP